MKKTKKLKKKSNDRKYEILIDTIKNIECRLNKLDDEMKDIKQMKQTIILEKKKEEIDVLKSTSPLVWIKKN